MRNFKRPIRCKYKATIPEAMVKLMKVHTATTTTTCPAQGIELGIKELGVVGLGFRSLRG